MDYAVATGNNHLSLADPNHSRYQIRRMSCLAEVWLADSGDLEFLLDVLSPECTGCIKKAQPKLGYEVRDEWMSLTGPSPNSVLKYYSVKSANRVSCQADPGVAQ